MIIYGWLSTKQKQVGKIRDTCQESTHLLALCSVKRDEIDLSYELC